MTIEGEIVVALAWDGHRVRGVDVRSSRSLAAPRVLIGKSAAAAAAAVPLLFSVCGGAQGAAAECALAAAGAAGVVADDPSRTARVIAESLQEGFRHLLIEWPNTMGSAPDVAPVAAARQLVAGSLRAVDDRSRRDDAAAMRTLARGLDALAAQALFGKPAAQWQALADVDALNAWAAGAGTLPARLLAQVLAQAPALGRSDIAPMPAPTRAALLERIVPALAHDDGYAHAPTWSGVPVETGALACNGDHPLVAACAAAWGNGAGTRIVARMVEMARLLAELAGADGDTAAAPRVQGIALAGGTGLGAVQTARGLLLHRATVRDERVVDYRIVAPTEWNFHRDGALARGLAGLEARDEDALRCAARLAVHTLDPCVASRVETTHA